MKRSVEILSGLGLTTTLALGATACGGASKADKIVCSGAQFASPKGGPGEIVMYVFPNFNRNFGDARQMEVTGQVVKGNDTGQEIHPVPSLNGAGEFRFSWDMSSNAEQHSVVRAEVAFNGGHYACKDTELTFNPSNYKVTPHLPNSPY